MRAPVPAKLPTPDPLVRGVLLALAALACGYVAGQVVAIVLLGEPMRLFGQGPAGMVPLVVATLVAGLALHYFATREQLSSEAAARSLLRTAIHSYRWVRLDRARALTLRQP